MLLLLIDILGFSVVLWLGGIEFITTVSVVDIVNGFEVCISTGSEFLIFEETKLSWINIS